MQCSACNHDNIAGSIFCAQCLGPLQAAAAAPAQPQAPARVLACPAAPQPRLVVIENAQPTGQVIPLPSGPYASPLLIGRNDLAGGVVVDVDVTRFGGFDKKVSRRHARLCSDGSAYAVEDWESAHGTWVNKSRLPKGGRQDLASGDEVRLAELVARFEIGG